MLFVLKYGADFFKSLLIGLLFSRTLWSDILVKRMNDRPDHFQFYFCMMAEMKMHFNTVFSKAIDPKIIKIHSTKVFVL